MTQAHATVIMVRHGATAWNEAGRYQGRADVPLSDAGRLAAAGLAVHLAAEPVCRTLSSPLRRAAETARPVAAAHGLTVEIDPALTEIDYGAWEGLTQLEVKQRWPDLLRQWKRAPGDVRFPGGESLANVWPRLRGAIAGLAASLGPGNTAVVITHQTIIRLALLDATGGRLETFRAHPAETATPYRFTLGQRHFRVQGERTAVDTAPGRIRHTTAEMPDMLRDAGRGLAGASQEEHTWMG